ncbi:MAG TPA: M14 family metallopeptidase [Longimicrobiaceae bacterium]|nr:M14 family metallopeptidase [Longimicrobiaceae bacterium]
MTPRLRSAALALALAGCAAAPAAAQEVRALRTRPESTDYRETSRYADVVAFLEAVDRASPRVHLTTFGYTAEGRALPLAVVGRVADASPRAVRAAGKTVVFIQGNIHAGEVEGKEAALALLRALAAGEHAAWLDSLVLLVAPIYNADGNERVALANRPLQHGPVGGMGTRASAQGLNLNRDYSRLDAPESRSAAALLRAYDPHVLLDLHTTNGTRHAYHLTYAPPLHPNTDSAVVALLRGEWLPAVTREVRRRTGWETYYYGNVPSADEGNQGAERGWYTYDHRPRFSSNYWGLRNRFGILSEAYAYLSFRDRIEATGRFVEAVLDYAHAHAGRIRHLAAEADARSVVGRELALTARLRRSDQPVEILLGEVDEGRHPYTGALMLLRRDVRRPERMFEFGTFVPGEVERAPAAYLLPAALGDALDRLEAHGVRVERLAAPARLRVEEFRVDSTRVAERPFEGRRPRSVWGSWRPAERELPAGTAVVRVDQPLGRLVFTLLEPRSDDGFAAWNLLGELEAGGAYPVLRTP